MGSSARGAGRAGQVEETGRDGPGWSGEPRQVMQADPSYLSGSCPSADVSMNSSLHLPLGQDAILSNNILDVSTGDTCHLTENGNFVDVPISLADR